MYIRERWQWYIREAWQNEKELSVTLSLSVLLLGVPADGLWANWISPGEARRDWRATLGAERVNWASLGDSFYSLHHFHLLLFSFSPFSFFFCKLFLSHDKSQQLTKENQRAYFSAWCDSSKQLLWQLCKAPLKERKKGMIDKASFFFFAGEWS